ncbi:diguanylate cyclase [Catenovulum sp. SM1970]|uniref:diguanylate cyclase domain-containing protein n=1 Tax=Marinifaba aquimaris TaxID=2741323 RepID=UPI001573BA9E|nr:diguanylate cyclase [Marinifaba aquimaris]
MNEKIYKYDQLTGLPNRVEIEELLKELQEEDRLYVFASIELDHSKTLNDNFGHQFEDLVLQTYSNFLQNNFELKENDRILRLGGEEFLLLLELDNIVGYNAFAESIARRLNSFNKESISASAVVMVWDTKDTGFDQLYPKVDQLLYKAKEAGRKRVCYLDNDGNEQFVIADL